MSYRYPILLLSLFLFIVFWFTIIFLCIPRSEPLSQWSERALNQDNRIVSANMSPGTISIKPPQAPDYMRYFQYNPPKGLSNLEIIFYEFNHTKSRYPNEFITTNLSNIEKTDHESDTLALTIINNPTDKLVQTEGYKLFAFNMLVSNRVGISRSLPDTRPAKCERNLSITTSSLTVSIIICYYNEAPSALLRTVYSIIERTPTQLIKEILIVDDFSEASYDIVQIQPYLKQYDHIVKFIRTPKREGLIRARLFGAARSSGDILVFLDSHVEANVGWLEPLLESIEYNKSTVACPMIDLINAETMIYSASPMVRGGLTWALHFKWDSVPSEDLKTYDDFAKPIKSPTMAGGLYAINREFFYTLGSYDRGMNLWGGENIELSMRTWMCGGQILILPCSRLGHIFRKRRPYGPGANEPDSLLYNSHRSARVWLDEHIDRFYESAPDARNLDSGDISERSNLRQHLHCKNFTWFLDNIYPTLKKADPQDAMTADRRHRKNLLFPKKI